MFSMFAKLRKSTKLKLKSSKAGRGFSLLEMLFATTISAMLFTSLLLSLDAMFKGYEQTTETAATQVVTRIAMNRILGMVRTGAEFGPFPADVLDIEQNPLSAHWFEFVTERDANGEITQIARIEFRYADQTEPIWAAWSPQDDPPADPSGGVNGPGDLWVVFIDAASGNEEARLLLSGVRQAIFTLHYDIGPQLLRATIDLTVEPDVGESLAVTTEAVPRTIRVVASAMPRRGVE